MTSATVERRRVVRRQAWLLVACAVLAVGAFFGLRALDRALAHGEGSVACREARDHVNDTLRALAVFGEDDPAMLAELRRANAERQRSCV